MKIVLSRKGFDSTAGGVPSPIFPDGSMCSIPIQAAGARTRFRDIRKGEGSDLGKVVHSVTRGRISGDELCHFDPDLSRNSLASRHRSWQPSLGQVKQAEGYLRNKDVDLGDVFLFFGWFRRVTQDEHGGWRFVPGSPDLHVVFGWLRICAMIEVPDDPSLHPALVAEHPWLANHPHLHFPEGFVRGGNRIYVGTEDDAGEFHRFDDRRVLTAPDSRTRNTWRLPAWMDAPIEAARGKKSKSPILHRQGEELRFSKRGQWQEFVIDCANRPEASAWIDQVVAAPQTVAAG